MDYGLIRIFDALLQAAGWKIAIGILVFIFILIAAVRMAPAWFQEAKERRQATRDRRAEENAQVRQDKEALLARLDRKDAILEKITGNHIQHLELQLAKSTEFYAVAVEALRAISSDQKETRTQLREVEDKLDKVKDITLEIKGGLA